MAGYSDKKLIEKLGIKPGQTVYLKDAPAGYLKELGKLPADVFTVKKLDRPIDFMHCFYAKADDLKKDVLLFQQYLELNGMLWISWPKKTSNAKFDITEQTLRDILLPVNLVDIKIAAISDTWSGLKFVWRKK